MRRDVTRPRAGSDKASRPDKILAKPRHPDKISKLRRAALQSF
jgi:hypothetical protein